MDELVASHWSARLLASGVPIEIALRHQNVAAFCRLQPAVHVFTASVDVPSATLGCSSRMFVFLFKEFNSVFQNRIVYFDRRYKKCTVAFDVWAPKSAITPRK